MKWIKTHKDRIVNLSQVEDVFLDQEELKVIFSLSRDIIELKFKSLEGAKKYFDSICILLEDKSNGMD
jgi:DNA-binding LytR/AlgR family response regulator